MSEEGSEEGNSFLYNLGIRSDKPPPFPRGPQQVNSTLTSCLAMAGHCYMSEEGSEEGNSFLYNLGIRLDKPPPFPRGPQQVNSTLTSCTCDGRPLLHVRGR